MKVLTRTRDFRPCGFLAASRMATGPENDFRHHRERAISWKAVLRIIHKLVVAVFDVCRIGDDRRLDCGRKGANERSKKAAGAVEAWKKQ